jgi:DNA-binding NarL/FixJ family response regulator
MRKPTLFIAEDHEVVGIGLRQLFEEEFEVYGPHADGATLNDVLAQVHPSILILDLTLQHRNGMYLIDTVRARFPATRIVVYTTYADFDLMEEARRRGADGYVGKDAGAEELRRALRAVLGGDSWFSDLIRPPKRRARGSGPHAAAIARLTTRRQEILALLGEGLTTTEIAKRLEMAERTVYWHRSMIRKALGIASEEDLARTAAVWLRAVRQAEATAPGSRRR